MKDASEHVDVSNSNNAKDEDALPKPMVRSRTRSAPSTYDPDERETNQKRKKKRYCSFSEQEPGLVQLCLAVRQILDKSRCYVKKSSGEISPGECWLQRRCS